MEGLASEAKPTHVVFPVGTTTKPLTCAPGHTFQAHSLQMILWEAFLLTSPILSWSCYKLSPYTLDRKIIKHIQFLVKLLSQTYNPSSHVIFLILMQINK